MKYKILILLMFAGQIFSSGLLNAQTVSMTCNEQEISVKKDTSAQITLFTGKHCKGKNYLSWEVTNQYCDGIYMIFKSFDGKNYEALGYKQGIGVPIALPIANYFMDENPNEGSTYYKLIHISKDNTYLVSDTISVRCDELLLSHKPQKD